MAKTTVDEWDTTASNNTDVGGTNIAEGCAPGNVNNAIRNMMAQIAVLMDDVARLSGTQTVSGTWTVSGTLNLQTATVNLAAGEITTADIANQAVTIGKLEDTGLRSFANNTATAANKIPYASAGDIWGELDFKDEDDMSSDSATALPSQQSVKAYVDGLAIGVGQTWQDMTGSRNKGTSYQNTTGRPIMVAIFDSANSSGEAIQVSANNSTWIDVGAMGATGNYLNGTSFIVPDDWYYRINGGTGAIDVWSELR